MKWPGFRSDLAILLWWIRAFWETAAFHGKRKGMAVWIKNIVCDDLSYFFDRFDRSFVLYGLDADSYVVQNKNNGVARVLPASTCKIYSGLIALETGVIDSARSVEEWNRITYPYEPLNSDQTSISDRQNSVSWYFQGTDTQVGIKELNSYFTQLSYGNHNLSWGIEGYWMEATLRILPVEQVELLKDFCQNDTIFRIENVDTMKEILRLSEKRRDSKG